MAKYSNYWKYLLFWLVFIGLNGLLNLSEWIGIQLKSDEVLNATEISLATILGWPNKSILLALVGDFLLLFLPILLLRKQRYLRVGYIFFASLLYLLLLYYNIYYVVYQSLYSLPPVFQNDWIILKEILPTFLNELSVEKRNYWSGLIIFLGISGLLFIACFQLLKYFSQVKFTTVFWVFGLGLIGYSSFYSFENIEKNFLNEENGIIKNKVTWIYPKIVKSATLVRLDHLAHLKKRWIYDLYLQKPLVQKPNVYLLFVESYGGVSTLTEECAPLFQVLAEQLEDTLQQAGWYSSSNYSKSTVIGGRSWLAMTTAMVGARIEDQIQYNGILKEHQTFPHLIEYFNQQGYETIRVSTMSSKDIDTLKMITIPNRFWGFDQRKMYSDIPYKGYVYDYYGGIPDQYTLGYVKEAILDTLTTPYFMSFITMNSHGPWTNAPPLINNWKNLDTLLHPYPNGRPAISMSIYQYWDLIAYELNMLTQFILAHDDNSMFILLGDHNPAGLEWKLQGKFNKWATPIHIISKDATFVRSFQQHGFTEGMTVDTAQYTIMRHMGLYSLLTRQLLEHYGEEGEVLPEYLPWGLRFD